MYMNVKPEILGVPHTMECDPTNTFSNYFASMKEVQDKERQEKDRLLKMVASYEKLVDRLEEQIETLLREKREGAVNDLLFKKEDQHDARLELHALYCKLSEVTGLRYYWNKIDKRLGVDPNQTYPKVAPR